jgi:hypothetical protein
MSLPPKEPRYISIILGLRDLVGEAPKSKKCEKGGGRAGSGMITHLGGKRVLPLFSISYSRKDTEISQPVPVHSWQLRTYSYR